MKKEILFNIILALGLVLGISLSPGRERPDVQDVYIEPGLIGPTTGVASVIATGESLDSAVRAVQAVGGTITQELWLIDAVAADIPFKDLSDLTSQPGLISIVNNKRVTTAQQPTGWDGWVSNMRVYKGSYSVGDVQERPAAVLPDGGFVSVGRGGQVIIVNADGSVRARTNLAGGPFRTVTVVANQEGIIFIVGEAKRAFALNPDGSIRWEFRNSGDSFLSSFLLGRDGRVYLVNKSGELFALAASTGAFIWKARAAGDGDVKVDPVQHPSGLILALREKGYLTAFDASGNVKWSYRAPSGEPFQYSPLIRADGAILIAGVEKSVHLLNMDGRALYTFSTSSKILAPPTLGSDGSLYIACENGSLFGLKPDGSLRFRFSNSTGYFKTSPVITRDQRVVFQASEQGRLFAIDTQSGAELWSYATLGAIRAAPALDVDGNVVIGSEGRDLVMLNPQGRVVFSMMTADKITQSPSTSTKGDVTVRVGETTVLMLGRLPDHWDGRKDVEATLEKKVWKLANPVALDVGADVLHRTLLPDGRKLDGQGVTIAVVDSGVYFSRDVKTELGAQISKLFVGQADFVNTACPTTQKGKNTYVYGTQMPDHCFATAEYSLDGFGHGSHVTGLMWNQFTDYYTNATMGVAPGASILSVRVLGNDGSGTYADVIKGIQYVVANKDLYKIRVMNLSMSANATTPYFADPFNRAVEQAWASGIVVVAAAGNAGPEAETITVPGNDPYVITVGAIDSKRTPGYWKDDTLPKWSSTGPTLDGFVKPDVLAPGVNLVSFMYNDPTNLADSAYLALNHPDYSANASLFRMSGTSMSTAVTSGVVALMLQAQPGLSPDQVKFRLKYSARPAVTVDGKPVHNLFQQGYGRIWAPDAVLGEFPADGRENYGMDLAADLSHGLGWVDQNGDGLVENSELDPVEMSFHYFGPIGRLTSDDGNVFLYYLRGSNGEIVSLGAAGAGNRLWLDWEALQSYPGLTWNGGQIGWPNDLTWAGGFWTWGGGFWTWGGGFWTWGGGFWTWGGGFWTWGGGFWTWGGGFWTWGGGWLPDASLASVSSTRWVDER